jgi:hypothetical protein
VQATALPVARTHSLRRTPLSPARTLHRAWSTERQKALPGSTQVACKQEGSGNRRQGTGAEDTRSRNVLSPEPKCPPLEQVRTLTEHSNVRCSFGRRLTLETQLLRHFFSSFFGWHFSQNTLMVSSSATPANLARRRQCLLQCGLLRHGVLLRRRCWLRRFRQDCGRLRCRRLCGRRLRC